MAFERPITIKEAIDHIHNNRYLLPAIQREFVWQPRQIERLFDSLMRGYPIGSFLFWRVDSETAKNYSFYQFITNYDQRKPHNPVHGAPSTVPGLTAVLDGQQRLTALNVALHGSGRWKLPRLWWNNPDAFPERRHSGAPEAGRCRRGEDPRVSRAGEPPSAHLYESSS